MLKKNSHQAVDEEGNKYYVMADCWYPGDDDPIRGIERCFDLYESDFAPTAAQEAAKEEVSEVSARGTKRVVSSPKHAVSTSLVFGPLLTPWEVFFFRSLSPPADW